MSGKQKENQAKRTRSVLGSADHAFDFFSNREVRMEFGLFCYVSKSWKF